VIAGTNQVAIPAAFILVSIKSHNTNVKLTHTLQSHVITSTAPNFSHLIPAPLHYCFTSTSSYLLYTGVCSRWRDASTDHSFRLRVFSVESGARDQVKSGTLVLDPRTYTCISDAMSSALPGDTISLCAGHHWESGLHPCGPVRLISGSSTAVQCANVPCVCVCVCLCWLDERVGDFAQPILPPCNYCALYPSSDIVS
jgi:hypothetical protein